MRLITAVVISLILSSAAAAVDPLDDLCYRVRWRLSSSQPKQQLVRPVSAFPAEHAKVTHNVCGGNNAGKIKETNTTKGRKEGKGARGRDRVEWKEWGIQHAC
jgi:hypothetical protein